ncbi:uncharacterized protein TRIREDRAFT_109905 [Trichoderma reesei QM6a]|uniref:Predicted protein n=2 Tax=Hypocrea jecorina TaxID=51453 RepID=G0RQQ7_HYPJQ|nr:uncharacterized protein TRIREDRAFT_109905 [Trichoderma reesei QM6a]EGR46390.1 predicted protein [Trichoderma reesei QM6a]
MESQELSQLSPLEWIMPRSYVSQILCFPSSNPRIAQVLLDGLAGTLRDVPYLASRVVSRDHPKGSVALSLPRDSLSDLFRVNSLLTTVDYNTLKSGGFKPSLFDGLILSSPNINPANTSPSPVFRAVLSLVNGGCLLWVSMHHSTADITAFGSLLKIWASYCRTGSSEDIQFDPSWLDRSAIVRQSHDVPADTPLLLHKEESSNSASQPSKPQNLETHFFRYSAQYLKGLKVEVNKHLPEGTTWVSTSDILTAIIWGSIVHSEDAVANDNVADETCLMRIAVNCRSRFNPPLPKNYLGAAFGVTLVNAKRADLIAIGTATEQTLSLPAIANVAASVRQSVNFMDGDKMKAIVKHLTSQQDVTNLKLCQEPAPRVAVVSWADQGVYELDWGAELGHCEAVRLPSFKAKRYPVVFPRLPNGDLEVLVSFDTETVKKWKAAYDMSPWKA